MYFHHKVERLVHVDTLVTGYNTIHPKNFYFPGEAHDFWEALFVCEGKVTVTADERVYRLNAGKLLFHKPMEFHRVWAENDSSPHLLIVSFSAGGEGMKRFENSCFDINSKQARLFAQMTELFPAPVTGDVPIETDDPLKINLAASMLETLLLELMEETDCYGLSMTEEERQYANIVNVMKANCSRMLSVEELAELCGLGVSNMKRIFSCFCDVGIAKYFLSLKMRRAMELLDDGMRASEVAEALDFTEISYFYTVFKREVGMTPSQYRKTRKA